MPYEQISEFVHMLNDILYVNGNLNICDSSFLKFIPLIPNDETLSLKEKKKYSDGQRKLANFLLSMLPPGSDKSSQKEVNNLFTKILFEALIPSNGMSLEQQAYDYIILPFIKKSFAEDFKWMMRQDEPIKVKYFHLFLHFYACYAITQAIASLTPKKIEPITAPTSFYFILNSEKASLNHDAVTRGWSYQIPKSTLDRLYGKSQTLDILNSILGGNVGFYSDVYNKLSSTPFEENSEVCHNLLELYQKEKREVFSRRTSEDGSIEEIQISVNSYSEFMETLEHLCTGLQSPSYVSRMRKKVIDLMSIRFLQSRRGNYVLVLDNEMLTFLIALFTKSKKTKLEDMYKRFNSYGIHFNRGSRMAIEEYLLKLNLLDRKSDSGEAQYVQVIL